MAFNPRSDVIAEVMSAADPARASLAAERLATLGQTNVAKGDFVASLAQTESPVVAASADGLANARAALASAAATADKTTKARTGFEAMLMSSFMNELLPKDAGDVFGKGAAGDMWRSMLGEQVAQQIAKSGALGLSRRLFATHDLPGAATETPTRVHATAQMSVNALSAPEAAGVVDGAILFAKAKRA